MHQVFDAIVDAHHRKSAHSGRDVTWDILQQSFYNISQDDVLIFLKYCPACLRQNVHTKKLPGAKQPIFSYNFRDRYQIDLIDKRSDPQPDIHGVIMRWILVIKDHFTGFTACYAIPRKRPKYVAHGLDHLFSLIGYPVIFHTDNGNEFTAIEILQFLKSINPNILSVTGRPRKPSDQGSVERTNQIVKNKLEKLEDEERLAMVDPPHGWRPNWVTNVNRVTASLNTMGGKDSNNTSAYYAVFGMPYHEQVAGSLDDIRKCDTIEERLSMFPNEGMRRAAEQVCILSEGSNAGKREESDENYWEAPSDTEEEGCNMGKVPATPLKSDAINNVSPPKPNKSKTNSAINLNLKASDGDNNGTGNKGSPLRKMTTMMKARRSEIQYTKTMPVRAALGGENAKLITRGDVVCGEGSDR
jgi:hypothetical protein